MRPRTLVSIKLYAAFCRGGPHLFLLIQQNFEVFDLESEDVHSLTENHGDLFAITSNCLYVKRRNLKEWRAIHLTKHDYDFGAVGLEGNSIFLGAGGGNIYILIVICNLSSQWPLVFK